MHYLFIQNLYHGLHRFDFDKFISAIQDVKQGVNERLRQWAEYEAQLEKLINWLGDSEVISVNWFSVHCDVEHPKNTHMLNFRLP